MELRNMWMSNFVLKCLLMSTAFLWSVCSAEKTYYTAAVLEHNRKGHLGKDTYQQIIKLNLDYFETAIQIAKSKDADIIIFPEYGVFPLLSREEMKNILEEIPDPLKVQKNPCNQKEEFSNRPMLYRLSCMAKNYNITIVANIGDIQSCTKQEDPNCPSDNTYHYNANAAFDRHGTLLAKYHKEHLFFEAGMDLPQKPQNPVFVTDFGTFSMYVCFDSMFKHIVDDAQKKNIDNIVLPTEWYDFMPFHTSIQWFQSWSLGNNVTFLVSNGQNPAVGTIGSGIFHGQMGALVYTLNPDNESKLLVSNVPKSKRQTIPQSLVKPSITLITQNGSKPYDMSKDGNDVPDTCDRNEVHKSNKTQYRCQVENKNVHYIFVKLTKPQDKLAFCNKGVCCSLEYNAKDLNETYYFGVVNGTFDSRQRYFFAEENCFLARCDSIDGGICNSFPLRSKTVFYDIKLSGTFSTKFVYPSVVTSGLRLAPMSQWTHGTQGENYFKSFVHYKSYSDDGMLITSLTGRCYDRDPPYK